MVSTMPRQGVHPIRAGNVRAAGRAALVHLQNSAKRSGVDESFELLTSDDYAAMMGMTRKRRRQ